MAPNELLNELLRIGGGLRRWQAAVWLLLWVAALLACVSLLSASDLFVHYERAGRVGAWAVLAAIVIGALGHIAWVLTRPHTPAAVAARMEQRFPQLDNHLINFVQFAEQTEHRSLEQAYLAQAVPGWGAIDPRGLRDPRRQRLGWLALGLAVLVAAGPWLWIGTSWTNAVVRILDPLSLRAPATLASFIRCVPGNGSVPQGDPLRLACQVKGRNGHAVFLDLWPADDKRQTLKLGSCAR